MKVLKVWKIRLGSKGSVLRFATSVGNELIRIRADQMESDEALTNRIDSVADQVGGLRSEMTGGLEGVEGRWGGVRATGWGQGRSRGSRERPRRGEGRP